MPSGQVAQARTFVRETERLLKSGQKRRATGTTAATSAIVLASVRNQLIAHRKLCVDDLAKVLGEIDRCVVRLDIRSRAYVSEDSMEREIAKRPVEVVEGESKASSSSSQTRAKGGNGDARKRMRKSTTGDAASHETEDASAFYSCESGGDN